MGLQVESNRIPGDRVEPRRLVGPPIDRAHLARYTFGSLPLELEVLGLFAEQTPKTMDSLQRASTGKAWRDAAHTLKGSAKAVGAWRLADCAERAEALHTTLDPAACHRAIEVLMEAAEEAISYINGLAPPKTAA